MLATDYFPKPDEAENWFSKAFWEVYTYLQEELEAK
jgi:hypothetical protein